MPEDSTRFTKDDSARARIAAYTSWANTEDPTERTHKARSAFMERFERQVDPDGRLAPAERQRRAEALKKAYFAGLALKSAQARRKGGAGSMMQSRLAPAPSTTSMTSA